MSWVEALAQAFILGVTVGIVAQIVRSATDA